MAFTEIDLATQSAKNAFRVIIRDGDTDILVPYSVLSVDQPSFSLNKAETHFLNHTFKYPGNVTWEPVSVTFYETLGSANEGGTILNSLVEIFTDSGYYLPSSYNAQGDRAWRTVSKKDAVSSLKQLVIQQLETGNNPAVVDAWKLTNPWVSSVKPDQLTYDADGVMKVVVSFEYDFAEQALGGQFNS